LTFNSTSLASGFEFFVTGDEDFQVTASQAVDRSNVADGRLDPNLVVMVDKITNHPLGIFKCEWGFGPDGLFFEGSVVTFQFAIALWVIGRTQDMGALPQADKFLEVFDNELRPVIARSLRRYNRISLYRQDSLYMK
jgi:hypothetical protein